MISLFECKAQMGKFVIIELFKNRVHNVEFWFKHNQKICAFLV